MTFNFNPGENATEVELVTNLNQRDFATADKNANGIDDGMREGIAITDGTACRLAAGEVAENFR